MEPDTHLSQPDSRIFTGFVTLQKKQLPQGKVSAAQSEQISRSCKNRTEAPFIKLTDNRILESRYWHVARYVWTEILPGVGLPYNSELLGDVAKLTLKLVDGRSLES